MSQTNPFADVFENWTKSFSQFTGAVPGLNVDGLMKVGQANIAAFTEANRVALEGFQAVARRQQEMAAEAFGEFQEPAKTITASDLLALKLISSPKEAAVAQTIDAMFLTRAMMSKQSADSVKTTKSSR